MSTATSVTKIMDIAARGGIFQMWSCLLTTTAITTAGQALDVVVIPGALSGDKVFVNAGSAIAGIQFQGAKVTATDVVTVYSQSNAWTTTLGTSAQVLDLLILKRGKGADTTSA